MKQPSQSERSRFAANMQVAAGARRSHSADIAAISTAFDAGAITEKYGLELAANLGHSPLPQAIADLRPKAAATAAKPRTSSPKVEGTLVSEASHPHLFAAFPALRQALNASGQTLMSDATLQAYERGAERQGDGDFRSPGIVTDTRRPHVGGGEKGQTTGGFDHAGMTAHERDQANAEVMKSWPPAARDRIQGGAPKTEMSAADLDAHFERSRAARAARRRH